MKLRTEQNLDDEMDVTPKEYKEGGSLRADYRQTDENLVIICDYDFLKHLQVGDELSLIHEETHNYSPWILYVELSDDDNDELDGELWEVTRKIYTAGSLDVYVIRKDDE